MQRLFTALAGLVLVAALALPATAHARRGLPAIVTYGDQMSHLYDVDAHLAAAMAAEAGFKPQAVGWFYQSFGLFWLDIWTWSGELCLYNGDTYVPIEAELAASLAGVDAAAIGSPLTYKMPPGLVIGVLLIAGFVGYRVVKARSRSLIGPVLTEEVEDAGPLDP